MSESSRTVKRLLSASKLGVNFDYGNGHRWINLYEDEVTDNVTLHEILSRKGVVPYCKVDGGVLDCLDYIDFLLEKVGQPSLEAMFDIYQDWALDEL